MTDRQKAWKEFRVMIAWIAVAGVVMVAGALWYLSLYGPLYPSMIFATVGGVFVSTLLGCGLFAAAFFSDKSGHDQDVTDATRTGETSPD
jgi:NhaP-type Na+/H+ or K+/H+ antiporter